MSTNDTEMRDQPVGELVKELAGQTSTLVRQEIQLAQAQAALPALRKQLARRQVSPYRRRSGMDHGAEPSVRPALLHRPRTSYLVELMTIFLAWSPKASLIALVSFTSPSGVDVPWAFM